MKLNELKVDDLKIGHLYYDLFYKEILIYISSNNHQYKFFVIETSQIFIVNNLNDDRRIRFNWLASIK